MRALTIVLIFFMSFISCTISEKSRTITEKPNLVITNVSIIDATGAHTQSGLYSSRLFLTKFDTTVCPGVPGESSAELGLRLPERRASLELCQGLRSARLPRLCITMLSFVKRS